MCTGTRMVRAWSAMARVMACRIHHPDQAQVPLLDEVQEH